MSVSVHKGTVFRNALVYGSEGGGGGIFCIFLTLRLSASISHSHGYSGTNIHL